MPHVEIKSRVGADGVLTISLPLGPSEANREVKITVEPTDISSPATREEWHDFVKDMAGCISDPTFRQPESIHSLTALASERVLAKDWLRPEEDEAWQDL
jgi:hypothetical protein